MSGPWNRCALTAPPRAVAAVVVLFAIAACTVDMNSRTEPLASSDDFTGQVPLFGVYSGILSGNAAQSWTVELVADDCGSTLAGTISFGDGTTAPLEGSRTGSAVLLESSAGAVQISLTGAIQTFRNIEGTWATSDGAGGQWAATYTEGSISDHPCPFAENLLESKP